MSIACDTINGEIYKSGNVVMTIGKKGLSPLAVFIDEELERLQWTQLDLEAASGIPDSTLGRIRAGQEPKPSQIARLAKAFSRKFWYICQRAGYITDDPSDPSAQAQHFGIIVADNPELVTLLDGVMRLSLPNRRAVMQMVQALLDNQSDPPTPPATE